MKPLLISTTLYGPWHLDTFERFCLPGLLRNMRDVECRLILHMRRSEVDQVKGGLPVGTMIWPDVPEGAPSELGWAADAQSNRWRADLEKAAHAGANIAFLPPDIAWGPGVLARYVELFNSGAGVIYHHLPRVDLDAAQGELEGVAKGRELARIALKHEHHLGTRFRLDSNDFPTHTENCSLTIPGGGVLTRLLAGAPLAMDPAKCGLNGLSMPDRTAPGLLAVIRDSDEAIGLSLAPAAKDVDWMRSGRPFSVVAVQAWLRHYTTPISPELARCSYKLWEKKPLDGVHWYNAEAKADAIIDKIFGGPGAIYEGDPVVKAMPGHVP